MKETNAWKLHHCNTVRDRKKLTFYGRAMATGPDNQRLRKRAYSCLRMVIITSTIRIKLRAS